MTHPIVAAAVTVFRWKSVGAPFPVERVSATSVSPTVTGSNVAPTPTAVSPVAPVLPVMCANWTVSAAHRIAAVATAVSIRSAAPLAAPAPVRTISAPTVASVVLLIAQAANVDWTPFAASPAEAAAESIPATMLVSASANPTAEVASVAPILVAAPPVAPVRAVMSVRQGPVVHPIVQDVSAARTRYAPPIAGAVAVETIVAPVPATSVCRSGDGVATRVSAADLQVSTSNVTAVVVSNAPGMDSIAAL